MIGINPELKEKYDNFYSDDTEEWRKAGAKAKANNILKLAQGYSFNNIVEIGSGDGNILSVLSEHQFAGHCTAVEISDSAIVQINKKQIKGLEKVVQFDGYHLPFEDNEFDLAICSHVIEHVEYPRKLLYEIKRISEKQIFEVPVDFSFNVDKKFAHFNAYGHINIYTPALFRFLLYTTGFKILNDHCALYDKKLIRYQYKANSLIYWLNLAKRFIWKLIPYLMKIKPNTYTVLTG